MGIYTIEPGVVSLGDVSGCGISKMGAIYLQLALPSLAVDKLGFVE
jgi:hypothetical protein